MAIDVSGSSLWPNILRRPWIDIWEVRRMVLN
jgi:hypothetical protein